MSSGARSDLAVRTVTGVIAIAVALGCLWVGGLPWWLLVSLAALVMMAEWGALTRMPRAIVRTALVLTGAVLLLQWSHILDLKFSFTSLGASHLRLCLVAAVLALLLCAVSRSWAGLGLAYVLLPSLGLLYLRPGPDGWLGDLAGLVITAWVLVTVWATDIGAYFAGRAIGGPKLAPRVSPNKTWAGLIGGALAAAVAGTCVLASFIGSVEEHYTTAHSSLLPVALVGAALGVLAQLGDLFESWLKRRVGAKDSGRLLPGHGGALDRLDGLVPVAALVALAVAVIP